MDKLKEKVKSKPKLDNEAKIVKKEDKVTKNSLGEKLIHLD